jgi:YYY domain-containing protein
MLPWLSWYLVVQICGVVAWPIAWRVFAALPDRGYAFSKHLGILLAGATLWFANAWGLVRNDRGGAWLSLALVAAAGLVAGRAGGKSGQDVSRPAFRWLTSNAGTVLRAEALFLSAFALWAWVRACDPAIAHTEQPMDFMFLNAVHTSPVFPPRDAWLAGYPISYYYAGYWLLSMLAFLSGPPVEVAYNLGQASWWALLLLGGYGLGANLARMRRRTGNRGGTPRECLETAAGLLSAAAIAWAGNLEFWLEWLHRKSALPGLVGWFGVAGMPETGSPPDNWWWWRSSRVLQDQNLLGQPVDIIDEFPFFSYLLGDNHPHMLSMPFLLLLLGLILALMSERPGPGWSHLRLRISTFVALALTLGMLALVNTWDLVLGALLSVLAFWVRQMGTEGSSAAALRRALFFALFLGTAVLVFIWPFLVSVQSQVTGIRPSILFPTRLRQFILMFGTLIPGTCVLFLWARRQVGLPLREFLRSLFWVYGAIAAALTGGYFWATMSVTGRGWLNSVGLSSFASLPAEVLRRWYSCPFTVLILGLCLAIGITLLARSARAAVDPATSFPLVLALAGVTLVCFPELIYLQDAFGTRMNTVFKLYYQAWPLLALAATCGIARGLEAGRGEKMLSFLGLLAIAAGLAYPAAAIPAKTGAFRWSSLTLNGIAHWTPDELAAVQWIRSNVPQDAIVAEAAGVSYHSETNRISAATGRATLLGWQGHEVQWRGEAYPQMARDRERVLQTIYSSETGQELAEILRSWRIDFLYVGPVERSRYGITKVREQELDTGLQVAFQSGTVRLYRPQP